MWIMVVTWAMSQPRSQRVRCSPERTFLQEPQDPVLPPALRLAHPTVAFAFMLFVSIRSQRALELRDGLLAMTPGSVPPYGNNALAGPPYIADLLNQYIRSVELEPPSRCRPRERRPP